MAWALILPSVTVIQSAIFRVRIAMSFASALRARILEPLGLDNTYLAGFEEGPDPFGAYTSLDGPSKPIDFGYTAIATGAWAAGGVVSSVADLHMLLSALFNERVSAESLAAMTENKEYGLGIARFSYQFLLDRVQTGLIPQRRVSRVSAREFVRRIWDTVVMNDVYMTSAEADEITAMRDELLALLDG